METPAGSTPVSDLSKPWNSATILYVARAIDEISSGKALDILDVGCGDGGAIELLSGTGHRVFGYDYECRRDQITQKLKQFLGDKFDERVHFATDGKTIPFEDNSFDVLFANQVFEHVLHLDRIIEECARVLRPGGVLIALFPFATYPLEGHLKIPFVHWVPPGRLRRFYMWPFYALRLRPRAPEKTARGAAAYWDNWLTTATFYRFKNEVVGLAEAHFENLSMEPAKYIQARIDLQRKRGGIFRRINAFLLSIFRGNLQAFLLTYGFMGVFVIKGPKKAAPVLPQAG